MLLTVIAFFAAAAAEAAPSQFKLEPSDFGPKYIQTWPILQYPQTAQTFHKTGKSWYRLTVDRATGKVTEVKVLQSNGVKILDDSAAVAFLQMRMKPNMIDHAVLGIEFQAPRYSRTGSHLVW